MVRPIYNADDGNSYASSVSLSSGCAAGVEGCVGALCGGERTEYASGPEILTR